ncbi:conjugal transfer protein TraF [Persephonella sp.]
MKKLILPVLLLSFSISFGKECKPVKEFYNDHERGWFYKEVCENQKEKQTQKKKSTPESEYHILTDTQVKIPWDKLDKLDPDDIYKLYKRVRKIAVMFPTKENVIEFQKLNIWMTEKGYKFMEQFVKVVRSDTELARYASSVPVSTIGRDTYLKTIADFKKQILKQYKDKAGLVIVVKQGCPYCERQKQILRFFALKTGWKYKLVDIHNVPNMVKKFGIARVPDIFLVLNKNGKPVWIRIGTGLHSEPELEEITVFGLYSLGEIKDNTYVQY